MRKRKIIKIDEREITIKEMTIKEIMDILSNFTETSSISMENFKEQINKILPFVSDISLDDIIKFAPSEAKEIYDTVAEVNAVFFDMAEMIGLPKILNNLKASIVSDFSNLVAGSLKQVT